MATHPFAPFAPFAPDAIDATIDTARCRVTPADPQRAAMARG